MRLIRDGGGDALFVPADGTQATQVETVVARAVEHYGGLNHAFNSAGIEGDAFVPTQFYSEATWDSVIDINLKGVFLSMKYELPELLKSRGSIVNMASVAGLKGSRLGVAYHASKHGVVGMTRAAAIEYADKGVRINAVAPAVIVKPMAERAFFQDPTIHARVLGAHPVGRLGAPEEVAQEVLWLCSKASSFTTGHVLPVDGGFLL